jgi:hypothetical protein
MDILVKSYKMISGYEVQGGYHGFYDAEYVWRHIWNII